MKNLFRILTVCLACAFCFAGCNQKSDETEQTVPVTYPKNPVIAEKFITEIVRPEGTDLPEGSDAFIKENPYVNPLTGLRTSVDLTTKRPVAVMINNIHLALPQVGISEADIMYETLEEGGITRLLCVYNDYENIPEIGSVRSARDYYIDIADAHDAIFVHAGGSTYAKDALINRGTDNIDGLYFNTFYRSEERRQTMSKEHTLMISGQGITQSIKQKNYRTTSDNPCPLVFEEETTIFGQSRAYRIEVPFVIGNKPDPYAVSFFDYDSQNKVYLKGQYGTEHIDGDDGEQLAFKNVLTLVCDMNIVPGDALGCIQVHFTGEGRGTYSIDGTIREIVWKKPERGSAYTLYEKDGETPLKLTAGKTYIGIVPTGTKLSVD